MPAPDIAAQRTLQIRNTARPPVCKWQVGGRRCAATRAKWGVLRCRVRSWAPPAASACRQRCQPSCHPVSKGSGATVKPSGTDQRTSLIPRLGAAPSSPSSPSPSCSPAPSNAGHVSVLRVCDSIPQVGSTRPFATPAGRLSDVPLRVRAGRASS